MPAFLAEGLYPVGMLHWVAGRIYRVHAHHPVTPEGTIRIVSLLALDETRKKRWVHAQIIAEVTALRTALLDERPVAFRVHLVGLENPILWASRRSPQCGIEPAFADLLARVELRPGDAINSLNHLTAAVNAALE